MTTSTLRRSGPGFVTPELALGLIAAAALVPGAKVEQSERSIAGQDSLCATASGLEAAASPGDKKPDGKKGATPATPATPANPAKPKP